MPDWDERAAHRCSGGAIGRRRRNTEHQPFRPFRLGAGFTVHKISYVAVLPFTVNVTTTWKSVKLIE